jgi:lipoate---protein ligase
MAVISGTSAVNSGPRVNSRPQFRVIDTGLRGARANIAFDQALIEAHKAGLIPDTIRFLRFTPSALVGRHQCLDEEIRRDWCRAHGVEMARRITGGGAIVMEPGILGWELVFAGNRFAHGNLTDLAAHICTAAARGLETLGIAARYRPRNDIEVDGRKIAGTGGFFDGGTIFYQGTLLLEFDPVAAMQPLMLAEPQRARHTIAAAADRVTTLAVLFGGAAPALDEIKSALLCGFAEHLGIDPRHGAVTEAEEALARRLHDEEIGTDEFVDGVEPFAGPDIVSAERALPGGIVRIYLKLEGPRRNAIGRALFVGDFFVTPPRLIFDLEAALKGVPAAEAPSFAERFLAAAKADILSIPPAEFAATLSAALKEANLGWPRS